MKLSHYISRVVWPLIIKMFWPTMRFLKWVLLQKILHENKIKSPQKKSLDALFEEKDFTPFVSFLSFFFFIRTRFKSWINIYIIIVLVRSWSVHALVGFYSGIIKKPKKNTRAFLSKEMHPTSTSNLTHILDTLYYHCNTYIEVSQSLF